MRRAPRVGAAGRDCDRLVPPAVHVGARDVERVPEVPQSEVVVRVVPARARARARGGELASRSINPSLERERERERERSTRAFLQKCGGRCVEGPFQPARFVMPKSIPRHLFAHFCPHHVPGVGGLRARRGGRARSRAA